MTGGQEQEQAGKTVFGGPKMHGFSSWVGEGSGDGVNAVDQIIVGMGQVAGTPWLVA